MRNIGPDKLNQCHKLTIENMIAYLKSINIKDSK